MRTFTSFLTAIAVSYGAMALAQTQQTAPTQLEQAPFASENAIIDTAIPFAIGAREAQQSLRGAFGWPTFQEGLVNGVYFRFDPDGYARFAPTPRLDTDVFEVICRPRTYSCMGRKGSFSVILNSRGQLQLKIDDILSGDRFFVSEGVSEIEIPERVLQPLDTQLELLLSAGGDLIVRRGDNEKDRISLTGFMPVGAYLRWVTARQDYTILPRGWPVPNAQGSQASVTQAASWQSPMPQPQNFPNGQVATNQNQPSAQPLQVQQQPTQTETVQTEVDAVKSELKMLRELLMERNRDAEPSQPAEAEVSAQASNGSIAQLMPQSVVQTQPVTDQIAALQQASAQIQADLQRLQQGQQSMVGGLASINLAPAIQKPQPIAAPEAAVAQISTDPTFETAKRLQYLMSEIGLDAKTALMLIQMGERNEPEPAPLVSATQNASDQMQNKPASQDTVVAQILKELESDLAGQNPAPEVAQAMTKPDIPEAEFLLLSQYFKSVVMTR